MTRQTRRLAVGGQAPSGQFWVQQRALDKPNNPGLWDTLMGSMVSSRDTVETALARETWEEAGLQPHQLHNLAHGGVLTVRKPSPDGNGAGYVVEHIIWYTCTVPDGVVPVNQGWQSRAVCADERGTAARGCAKRGFHTGSFTDSGRCHGS